MDKNIRVLVVDDHTIVRQGICELLNRQERIEVVGNAADGRTAVSLTRKLSPDIVVMDVSMPELNGIDATQQIVQELPNTKVIALSMHSSREFVLDMLRAGASAYLLKESLADELIRAVHLVADNKRYLDPEITAVAIEECFIDKSGKTHGAASEVSAREREVLQLLVEGKTAKEIAQRLHVSTKTVDSHRRSLMMKLQLNNLADLVKYAIREGITTVE